MKQKAFIWLLAVVSLASLVFILVYGFGLNFWARRLIYPEDSRQTDYPGAGRETTLLESQTLVVPQYEPGSFYVKPENVASYEQRPDEYTVYNIPVQEKIKYEVGFFNGWEEIAGSQDKYMLVNDPVGGETGRWRLAFANSALFDLQPTALFIETVNPWFMKQIKNSVSLNPGQTLPQIGFAATAKLLKINDTVILIPVFAPPEVNKKDDNGYLLAGKLIIRRARQVF